MKVALVHDWLVSYRGGERVLEALCELFPEAPIYTLFYDPQKLPETFHSKKIICPPVLQRALKLRKLLLPVLPVWIESFDLQEFDLVISTSSCVAKGVLVAPGATHFCYLHSPMRYIWDQQAIYLKPIKKIPIVNFIANYLASRLRIWDVSSAPRVDTFIANSRFVAQRIKRFYGRESTVIAPPVDTDFFSLPSTPKKGGYFLAAGAFTPYKGFELAIAACRETGKELIIAGSGPSERSLRACTPGKLRFHINPKREEMRELMQNADALLFPGVEDFGIVAVEAMACGTPVIALNKGGALDFVKEGYTGQLFEDEHGFKEILRDFMPEHFSAKAIRQHALNFSKASFLSHMQNIILESIP